MDRETLVYVDLDGAPRLDGAAVGPCAQEQGKRHFRIRRRLAARIRRGSPWNRPCRSARPVSHAGRHADVRRDRRLSAGPVGTGIDAPHGTKAR